MKNLAQTMKYACLIFCTILIFSCNTKPEDETDLAKYVHPFIGTGGHGHTFPGATMPFGMVQLSPDTRLDGWDGCSGYHYSDTVVYGFSHTHLSGTGVSDYGDVLMMPTVGQIQLNNGAQGGVENGYASAFYKDAEIAEPGYYFTKLKEGEIDVELTATERAGFHKYTFLTGDEQNIIIDLAHRDQLIDWKINQVSATKITGFRISKAWAIEQHIYFVAEFSSPIKSVVLDSLQQKIGLQFGKDASQQLFAKVGISPVSIANAEENLKAEIPDWDFEKVKENARAAWNKQLGKIEVKGNEDDKIKFYTSLYHTMIAPNIYSDVNGDYRGMDLKIYNIGKGKPQYTVFSLWDTFRATHPLYTIIEQDRTNAFVQTFLRQHAQGGLLPVWELAANETNCMIGYHSAAVIADAYAKNLRDFDAELALTAMVKSATQNHFGLEFYKKQGFISAGDEPESVSKTLEYAYDDWCIATMAKAMGKDSIANVFYKRSENWKNLLDPETGFFRARVNNGWFGPFFPEEVNFNYTEANAWQYSLFVPHDVYSLDELLPNGLYNHLNALFDASSETKGREQADITGLIGQYAHGNEPSHHMAYLYNYVGMPQKTQAMVHRIKEELYTTAPDGLSGNEDCGQMSAWYVFSALGIYPVTPGSPIYAIGSPTFKEATINLENGKTFTVKAKNWSKNNFYIQNATLNGQPYQHAFLHHDSVMAGGILEFTMAKVPNAYWGSALENYPPLAKNKQLLVPTPFFSTNKNTFVDSLAVQIKSLCEDCSIIAGFENESQISIENQNVSFNLKKDSKIWAVARTQNGRYSDTIFTTFYKIDDKLKLTLKSKYANEYAAGGDDALIDKQRGTANFRTGRWQGYQGQNFEAVLDFGELLHQPTIFVGFLQDVRSWIWFPPEIHFYFSADGKSWDTPIIVRHNASDRDETPQTIELSAKSTRKAAYVKIVAKNYGFCPDWHLGAGGKSWLFLDEIDVRTTTSSTR